VCLAPTRSPDLGGTATTFPPTPVGSGGTLTLDAKQDSAAALRVPCCVTDHTTRSDDPWLDPSEWSTRGVRREVHASYVADILREAARGLALYDLLVLPGIELTYNAEDPDDERVLPVAA
jgi:hypothetical protein